MAEKKKTDSKKSSAVAVYGRVAFYLVVVAVIAVILLIRQDRSVQNLRAETTSTWNAAIESNEALLKSAMPPAVGDPEVSDMIQESSIDGASMHEVYTWKGIFGSYTAEVHYANTGGNDPIVQKVVLP